MKISQLFNLDKTQFELDFVDVDIEHDNWLFLDPFFISTRNDPWSVDATRVIKSFFQYIIDLTKSGDIKQAKSYFTHLNEPNETCLGMSKGNPRGNGVGNDNAEKIFDSLLTSKAMETGLVENLEDSAIFIDGIARDKVSDVTTNIIRRNLIEYTKNQCDLWGIPITNNCPSGFYWDQNSKKWDQSYTERLVIKNKLFLLVPKNSVTFYKDYIDQKYYQHYVLNFLQDEHMKNNSPLVQHRKLKDGTIHSFVTKKDIKEKDSPFSKELLREFTRKHPDIFANFRNEKKGSVKPLSNEQLTNISLNEVVEYLVKRLDEIQSGGDEASKYHRLMIGVLELIFYPHLTNPIKEREINEGRKRIDITMDNAATNGFFHQLHDIHKIASRFVYIECKNYSDDPENPELDQLSGRFSVNTSNFGILACRVVNNKKLMSQRCVDLYKQKRELIIVLDDGEIKEMLNHLLLDPSYIDSYLCERRREIELS